MLPDEGAASPLTQFKHQPAEEQPSCLADTAVMCCASLWYHI